MKSTRVEDAPRLSPLKGVEMVILGSGEKMTFIKIVVQPGSGLPEHSHLNEQIGACLEGKGELKSGGETIKVEPGVSWSIPSNEVHSFIAKGDSPVVIYEVWSPPRTDYLAMAARETGTRR